MKVIFLFPRRTFRGDFDSSIHITRLVGRGEETYLQKKPSLKQYISSTQQHHHYPYTQLFISQELFGVERSSSYCSKCKKIDITILTSIVLLQKPKRNKTYMQTQIKFEAIYLQHLESAPPYIYSISYISGTVLS